MAIKNFKDDLLGIFLRGCPILLKFAVFALIPITFSIEDLGLFGIVIASTSIISTIIGLELYQITNRIFVKQPEQYFSQFLSFFLLYLTSYLVVLPLSYIVLDQVLNLDQNIIALIVTLSIIEHGLLEIYRLFISKGYVLTAHILYFLKNGVWPIAILISLLFLDDFKSIIWFMAASNFLVLIIYIMSLRGYLTKIKFKINFSSIKLYFFYYLFNTLSRRAVTYFDRYIAAIYFDLRMVGIITFYTSIVSSVNQLVEAVASVKFYKKFVMESQYDGLIKDFKKSVNLYYGSLSIIILLGGFFLFHVIDSSFEEEIMLLAIYLFGFWIFNLAASYHYALYSQHSDKSIFIITIVSILTYIFLVLYGIDKLEKYVFPLSVLVYSLMIFVLKRMKYYSLKKSYA